MSTSYNVTDGVAVITLENPPVNGLGHGTRSGIVDGIHKANADAAVQAVVIIGSGKVFCGGADIREFGSPKAFAEPGLHAVIAQIGQSAKPVVAAIHGVAMGGGLELALGCHYRVVSPGTQIALPEVNLGLVPGAGGTQRLPRVLRCPAKSCSRPRARSSLTNWSRVTCCLQPSPLPRAWPPSVRCHRWPTWP